MQDVNDSNIQLNQFTFYPKKYINIQDSFLRYYFKTSFSCMYRIGRKPVGLNKVFFKILLDAIKPYPRGTKESKTPHMWHTYEKLLILCLFIFPFLNHRSISLQYFLLPCCKSLYILWSVVCILFIFSHWKKTLI